MSEPGSVDAVYRQILESLPTSGVGQPATPAPAVAVILWRQDRHGGQVYLVERAPTLPFLGGYWTFPGGRVEPGDVDYIGAAVRELEEETGVALGDALRGATPAGRWVTPEFLSLRYDARYLFVRLGTDVSPDPSRSGGELTGGEWIEPRAAIERFERGQWLVPSPVLRVLTEMSRGTGPDLAARIDAQAAEEAASTRRWAIAPAIEVCPVRTPTLPPATDTNCYLVGERELVVVDPASPYEEEQAALDAALDDRIARGARVREIWLTHHHQDHVRGAARVSARYAAPIAAHPETAARLAGQLDVSHMLEEGARIELAGTHPRSLRAVFTPGHAPGHLCFLEESTGMMLAGDMVAGIGTILIDPSEGDMAAYLASLALLRRLGPSRLLPSHGGVIADPAARLDEYVRHRLWRERRVIDALRERGEATPRELVPIAYSDVSPAIHALAERSLVAHLRKLAADGVATSRGQTWALADRA